MKNVKTIIGLLVVCLLFAGALVWHDRILSEAPVVEAPAETETPETTEAPAETETETEAAAEEESSAIDFDALYALHDGAEIVMTADGEEISWDEYFSWLKMNALQIESSLQSMAAYGMSSDWSDPVDASSTDGQTIAEYAVESAEDSIKQLLAIRGNAKALGFVEDEDFEQALAEQRESDIQTVCGEGATEEDFLAALADAGMTPEVYDRICAANAAYSGAFTQVYGASGELVSDADALKYLTDEGYIYANHILLMTIDSSTGEELDEAAAAEKKAKADEIYAELSAIEDTDALVARFKELKDELCEDTGKATYPDGYVFTSGTMVTEFEDACAALGDYGLSEPVKSDYGYHIILRLPLDPDAVMGVGSDGTTVTARYAFAATDYGDKLSAYLDGIEVSYADGFERPQLIDFIAA